MNAFLDDYGIITAMIERVKINDIMVFSLRYKKQIEELEIINIKDYNQYVVYTLRYNCNLELHKKYRVDAGNGLSCNLYSGAIIRTKKFDDDFYYDGFLGVEYSKKKSVFKVWSPVANKIILVLDDKKYSLNYTTNGVWKKTVEGDFEGKKYHYIVSINDKRKRILDPYGISSDTNGKNNYVVDINQFKKFKFVKPEFSGNYVDAVLYEASVRDMSYHSSAHAKKRGKFVGMLENHPTNSGLPTGLEYLKYLGVTHVQLMPTYDFDGIDDTSNKKYNWGYNPHQYFVPCGWYSTNPEDPYARINEFIKLIDGAHQKGLRVVLDVVFNHVFDYRIFPLEALVPGYFYRVDLCGQMTEVTGCQNDLATERKMTRKLIIDNLVYLAKVYNVDGFRFDLMGLLDIPTMTGIREKLLKIDEKIMLYGEGWNMPNTIPNEMRPHMYNHSKMTGYAFFNDSYRDFFRGSQWHHSVGYAIKGKHNFHDLFHLLAGSCINEYKFKSPNQTINYVECHDNYTFYDFAKANVDIKEDRLVNAAKLALSFIIISQGIPFIHSGQEFLRTKRLVENSYNKGDEINCYDYNRRDKYIRVVNMVKDLIAIRKAEACLRFNNAYDIMNEVCLSEIYYNTNSCKLKCGNNLFIIIKNSYVEENIMIAPNYMQIFDGWKKVEIANLDKVRLMEPGIYIFKKEE